MPYVKQLVDDVLGRQATRVEDRRLAPIVISHHADEAVADAAELVGNGEGRDPLEADPVVGQTEPVLPLGQPPVCARRGGIQGVVRLQVHMRMNRNRILSSVCGRTPLAGGHRRRDGRLASAEARYGAIVRTRLVHRP
jgi:hypothetical protein